MRFAAFFSLLFAVLYTLHTTQAALVDDFGVADQLRCSHPARTGPPPAPYPAVSCEKTVNNPNAVGGSRDLLVRAGELVSFTAASYFASTGVIDGQNLLLWSVPSGQAATLQLKWDGPPTPGGSASDINYRGLGGVDFTDGGLTQGILFRTRSSDLAVPLYYTFYTDETHASQYRIEQNATNEARTNNSILAIPFSSFFTAPFVDEPADFTNIGAIIMQIDSPTGGQAKSVDLSVTGIRSVGLITVTKEDVVIDQEGIGNPGETIQYTSNIINDVDLLALPIPGLYFYDNPSTLSPYLSLLPGTVTVRTTNDFGVVVANPPTLEIFTGNSPGDAVVDLYYGPIPDGFTVAVIFNVTVGNLLCEMPTCAYPDSIPGVSPGCQLAGQSALAGGRCLCSQNQGYVCFNIDEATADAASDKIAAGNVTFIAQNCRRTNDPATASIATSDPTDTPIWGIPDPAITKLLVDPTQSTGVFPGSTVAWINRVTNNNRRQSGAVRLCDQIPTGTTFSSTLSVGNTWTDISGGPCNELSSTCCTELGQLAPQSSLDAVFGVVIDNTIACDVGGLESTATITSSNTQCPDSDLNNNSDDITVPLIGGADVFVSKTANKNPVVIGTDSTIVYTITYGNSGSRDAEGAVIYETLAAGFTFNSAASGSWTAVNATHYQHTVGRIAPGATNSVTFAINLPAGADCDLILVENFVYIEEQCGDSNPDNNNGANEVTISAAPNLALDVELSSAGDVTAGSTVCYNLNYENIGTRTSAQTVITETVPANSHFTTTGSTAGFSCANDAPAGTTCTLSLGQVLYGASGTATFCVVIDASVSCGASITNNARINATCGEIDLTNNQDSVTAPIAGAASLSIVKTANVNSVSVGGTIIYTLTYSNTGNGEATAVTIQETVPLPALFSFESSSSTPGWTLSGNTYSLSVGTLAPAGSGEATFAIRLAGPTVTGCTVGPVSNSATISQSCGGAVSETSNTVITPINAVTDLYVSGNDTNPVNLAQTTDAMVPFNFGNLGVMSAQNVVITATIPEFATGVPDGNFQLEGDKLVANIPSINGLSTPSALTLHYTIQRPIPCGIDSLNVQISISTGCNETNLANNVDNVVIPIQALPDLVVTKTDNLNGESVRVGSNIHYTISYHNAGYRHGTEVSLTEHYSEYVTPSAGSNPIWTCDATTRTCVYDHPTEFLSIEDPVQTVEFYVTINDNIPSRSTVVNTVSVDNTCGDSDLTNNEDTIETPVVGNPDLVVHKTDHGVKSRPDDIVRYEITYENIGDSTAGGVFLTETVPPYSRFNAAASTPGWDCPDRSGAGTVCRFEIGTVERGAVITTPVIFAIRLGDWLRCGIDWTDNVVRIDAEPGTVELSLANNEDSVRTCILARPNLRIHVTDNLNDLARWARVRPGEVVTYHIEYDNCGNRDATNATVGAYVPQYTTFTLVGSTPGWNCSEGAPAGTLCVLSVGDLMPMDMGSANFTVVVADNFPPQVKGTREDVFITNDCDELDLTDNDDHDFTPFVGIPDLFITETARCKSIVWYIEFSNLGDQSASNVVIADSVPDGTNFDAGASTDGWNCNAAGDCVYTLQDELAPGEGGHLYFVTTPINGTSGVFTNVVTIDGTGRPGVLDPTPQNNRDVAVVGFDGCPISCDSCCPEEETCCPDKTEVVFNFGGILDGVSQCQLDS